MFNEINLNFINKTSIPPNIPLEGYRVKMASFAFNCEDYDCNCEDYDCHCDCDCDCDCDCFDYDCNDFNPYDLDEGDYEAWIDSLDD